MSPEILSLFHRYPTIKKVYYYFLKHNPDHAQRFLINALAKHSTTLTPTKTPIQNRKPELNPRSSKILLKHPDTGITKSIEDWAASLELSPSTFYKRYKTHGNTSIIYLPKHSYPSKHPNKRNDLVYSLASKYNITPSCVRKRLQTYGPEDSWPPKFKI